MPEAVIASNASRSPPGRSSITKSSPRNRWRRDDRSSARAGALGMVPRRTRPSRRQAPRGRARRGCGAAVRINSRSAWFALYGEPQALALDVAGFVDQREHLGKAGKRVDLGGRRIIKKKK